MSEHIGTGIVQTVKRLDEFNVVDIRFEHYHPAYTTGIQEAMPRISWKFHGAPNGFRQQIYDIEISDINRHTNFLLYTHTVMMTSDQSTLVPWPFRPLISRQRVSIRVRAGGSGVESPWSKPAEVEAGLLNRTDWTCFCIFPQTPRDITISQPEEIYRREFFTRRSVSRARLYITARGLYEAEIDGKRVGDNFLTPGWTSYSKRLQYQTYDVTSMLQICLNFHCIGIRVVEGWFCGWLGDEPSCRRNIWGAHPMVMAQLEISYLDGSSQTINTGDRWTVASGPIDVTELYNGEKYDARFEIEAWSLPTPKGDYPMDSADWRFCSWAPLSGEVSLVAGTAPPVRRMQRIPPVKQLPASEGKIVVDFGRRVGGYTHLKNIQGATGHKISLDHGEILENGKFSLRFLPTPSALDEYTLSGRENGSEWAPRFTYHGFRYVQVQGWPDLRPESLMHSIEAVVCYSHMEKAFRFTCSSNYLCMLHKNIVYAMQNNFMSTPSNHDQRVAPFGWSADIALFAKTATFLYNCTGMLANWLMDAAADQDENGDLPTLTTPDISAHHDKWGEAFPCAIWHDATILVPWALYQETGDVTILRRQYTRMERWLSQIPRDEENESPLWDPTVYQFGDLLDKSASADFPLNGLTSPIFVADAFLVHSLDLISQIAEILGLPDGALHYKYQASHARSWFQVTHISEVGQVTSSSQTAYALAIAFDLFKTPMQEELAGEHLAELVRKDNLEPSTGIAGTPFILEALVKTGHVDLAYGMLFNKDHYGWLYPVLHGSSSIPARWNNMLKNPWVRQGLITSRHLAFASVATFLHERIGGLKCLEPGWRRIGVQPLPGAGIFSSDVSHLTPTGWATVRWEVTPGLGGKARILITLVCPPMATMELTLPLKNETSIMIFGSGKHSLVEEWEDLFEWPLKL